MGCFEGGEEQSGVKRVLSEKGIVTYFPPTLQDIFYYIITFPSGPCVNIYVKKLVACTEEAAADKMKWVIDIAHITVFTC